MRYFETPHFQRFSRSHIGAREFVGYQIQIKKIFADVREKGRLERTLFTRDGESCITYYYFDPVGKTLYVLAAHLARKGEPKPDETKAIEAYVRQIEGGKS